jgi:hypothetical protein
MESSPRMLSGVRSARIFSTVSIYLMFDFFTLFLTACLIQNIKESNIYLKYIKYAFRGSVELNC